MHHETLQYILHRLPLDQKVRPAGLAMPRIGGEPPSRRTVRVAAGSATLGADRDEIPFGWDNEFPRMSRRRRRLSRSTSTASRTATSWSSWMPAATEDESLWDRRRLGMAQLARRSAPALLGAPSRCVDLAGNVGPDSAADGLAGVRVARRGLGVRPMEGARRLPTEAEFHRAAYGTPEGAERAHPWGDAPPDPTRGHFDFAGAIPCPSARFRGARAPGACAISSATAGSGPPRCSRRFRVSQPMPSYPAVLRGLLRRKALRHEGRLAGNGEGAHPPQLPQLVPADVSLRLREVPHRGSGS